MSCRHRHEPVTVGRVGKVQVIRVVLMIFALASMLCATAPTYPAPLGLRLLTGLAAAAVI